MAQDDWTVDGGLITEDAFNAVTDGTERYTAEELAAMWAYCSSPDDQTAEVMDISILLDNWDGDYDLIDDFEPEGEAAFWAMMSSVFDNTVGTAEGNEPLTAEDI